MGRTSVLSGSVPSTAPSAAPVAPSVGEAVAVSPGAAVEGASVEAVADGVGLGVEAPGKFSGRMPASSEIGARTPSAPACRSP